ncbi:helix-turn-helix domain-containing protein [Paenibacillus sp. FSL H8-0034]|uniref:helix-turn-helix domain-containing protein n=1 Tax=Paenibacillus sp. FSL H8-0034 TaxID=2954671 RepID=UPI0030F6AB25
MSSDFVKLVGERIRTIRKEKGYTQESLAEKSGVYITYISDIERGERNITLETLDKVITALDILPSELFKFENIESIEERTDKKILLNALNSLVSGRKVEEIQLVLRMMKDMLDTYSKINK